MQAIQEHPGTLKFQNDIPGKKTGEKENTPLALANYLYTANYMAQAKGPSSDDKFYSPNCTCGTLPILYGEDVVQVSLA